MAITTKVEKRKFRLSELEAAAYNPRQITDAAMKGLQESLETLGLLDMIVVNVKRDPPRVVSGHQRRTALMADGVTHADCVVVRMDDAAEMSANLAMNNRALRGTWDVTAALPVLESVESSLPDAQVTGFAELADDLRRQAARLEAQSAPQAADDVKGEEGPAKSEIGTVYQLGDHRLLCGDFRGLGKVVRKRATACIVDPPYNVAYDSSARPWSPWNGTSVEGDAQEPEAWEEFLSDLFDFVLRKTSGLCYVFSSSVEAPTLEQSWESRGGLVMRWLFWIKDHFAVGRSDYHSMHEQILWGAREGANYYVPTNPRTNALQHAKPAINELHPTQKPVDLIEALMLDSTDVRDVVLDPCAGSGTTLVVAQQLKRVCYAAELKPQHCDTTRRRWAEQVYGQGADWVDLTPGKKIKE